MLQDYTQGDIEMILVGVIGNIVRSKWNGDSMLIIKEGVASLEVVIHSQMWMYREAVPMEENIEELRKVMQEVSSGAARERIDELLVVLLRAIAMWRNGDSGRIDLQAIGCQLDQFLTKLNGSPRLNACQAADRVSTALAKAKDTL